MKNKNLTPHRRPCFVQSHSGAIRDTTTPKGNVKTVLVLISTNAEMVLTFFSHRSVTLRGDKRHRFVRKFKDRFGINTNTQAFLIFSSIVQSHSRDLRDITLSRNARTASVFIYIRQKRSLNFHPSVIHTEGG